MQEEETQKRFPLIVWSYWEQGFENAPYAVKACAQTVQHYAKDFEIHFLDEKSLLEFITPPPVYTKLPMQCRSDLIRILLLEKYGGVWLDATVCLNAPLSTFLEPYHGDFFCTFRWKNKTSMSNWFLCASKNSYVAKKMSAAFLAAVSSQEFFSQNEAFFSSWKGSPNYFLFHRIFEDLQKEDKTFGNICRTMPWLDSYPLIQFAFYGWNKNLTLLQKSLIKDMPLLKLSWTQAKNPQELNPNGALALVQQNMRGAFFPQEAHIHLATELSTMFMLNSYINRPEYMKNVCGVVDSEADLALSSQKAPRYHVFNFSSFSQKDCAQLLIPYNQDRLFLRHQNGNTFCPEVEFVSKASFEQLQKELFFLKEKLCKLEKRLSPLEDFCTKLKAFFKKIPLAKRFWRYLHKNR